MKLNIIEKVNSQNSNANGFDIYYPSEEIKIIAEIKCNIPINKKSSFGAAQRNGILKDIESLLYG
jgi:hypothetical protein